MIFTPAFSPGREVLSSDVQYYFKQGMAYSASINEGVITAAWTPPPMGVMPVRNVIRVDSTSKQPPEASDPTTFEIPSDERYRIFAESITGRPTLANGTAEVVYDGALLDLFNTWTNIYGDKNLEYIICSVAMFSKRTNMLRIYPRVEILAATAGSISSENTYMTMTINFARRDRGVFDNAFSVYPTIGGSNPSLLGRQMTAPPTSAVSVLMGSSTYPDYVEMFMTDI